jgi:hypothetical protein
VSGRNKSSSRRRPPSAVAVAVVAVAVSVVRTNRISPQKHQVETSLRCYITERPRAPTGIALGSVKVTVKPGDLASKVRYVAFCFKYSTRWRMVLIKEEEEEEGGF